MDLSICIVSFNTRAILEETLRAARAAISGLTAEVIVVDNGSSDGSARWVSREAPEARLIANAENRFFSAAVNQSLEVAVGRAVLWLNSDVKLPPNCLAPLVAYLEAHAGVGAITVGMGDPDGRLQRTCARFSSYPYLLLENTWLGRLRPRRLRKLRRATRYADWDRTTPRAVEVLPGSFLLARRDTLHTVGPLDERFRLYFSDDDWCLRLHHAGLQAMFLPVAGVIHREGASARHLARQARRIYYQDLIAYTGKYFGRWPARWLRLLALPTLGAIELGTSTPKD
jgi:hypothetical protein